MSSTNLWKKVLESDVAQVVSELQDNLTTPAAVILTGPVGAGKTTLAKFFSEEEDVFSPTYSIINEFENHAHADLYRIEDPSELIHLELPLYLEDKEYFLIEWGRDYLPELKRLIDSDFNFYELIIDPITLANGTSARNYTLNKVD
ncbi:MAG: tRNA (adenosine(37)-N6)-threonylcarbamoyltransferase complex ATPase subunit type 1 TsaE [Bacteriovoracaceae bacterium]|nr:tRNA (adenosine(37)-N6)-threonylcarbamoyltransferase complex ATPase subunit type 1 TsaE [Bacteriovoracaceae bacterium]